MEWLIRGFKIFVGLLFVNIKTFERVELSTHHEIRKQTFQKQLFCPL